MNGQITTGEGNKKIDGQKKKRSSKKEKRKEKYRNVTTPKAPTPARKGDNTKKMYLRRKTHQKISPYRKSTRMKKQ
jgi:hypothetical protein